MSQYNIKYGDTLTSISNAVGMSVNDLLKLNPSISNPDKIQAGRTLNLGGNDVVVPKPNTNPNSLIAKAQNEVPDYGLVPQPQAPKTMSPEDLKKSARDSLQQRIDAMNLAKTEQMSRFTNLTKNKTPEEREMEAIGESLRKQATQKVDDQEILSAKLRALQPYFDLINKQKEEKISAFRDTTAKDNLGSRYASAAAGGRIGSATGDAEIKDVQRENSRIENEYRTEAELKISALMGQATGDAQRESAERRASIQQGIDKYLEYLGNQTQRRTTRASDFVKNMLALGIDPSSLTDTEVSEIQNSYGLTREQITAMYGEAMSAQKTAALAANKPFELSEGQAYYTYNPITGKYEQVANMPKTYKPESSSGSGSSSSGGYGGASVKVSSAAQNIIDQLNIGANIDDLIKGSSNAAQQLRNEVLAGLNAQGGLTNRSRELFQEAKNAVDSLIETKGYKALGGYSTVLGKYTSTAYGDAQARAQQLEAILARDNLGLLKGAMSDKDLAFIQSMSSGFKGEGIQSESFIKSRLEEIQKKLETKINNSTPKSTGTEANADNDPLGLR